MGNYLKFHEFLGIRIALYQSRKAIVVSKLFFQSLAILFALAILSSVEAVQPTPEQCRAMMRKAAALNPRLVESDTRVKGKPPFRWKKFSKSLAIIVTTLVGVPFGVPTAYQELSGKISGNEHIGLGIHLDLEKIESLLKPEELALLRSPTRTPQAVATMFANYLNGDYVDPGLTFWPVPKNASDYFRGQSCARGICRHKATVLAGLLQAYGIKARFEVGKGPDDGLYSGHQWVVLEESDEVVDPTSDSLASRGYIMPRDQYFRATQLTPSSELKSQIIYGFAGGAFR